METDGNVAKTFAIGKLGKGHAQKLIVAGEFPHPVISLMTLNTPVEFVLGQEVEDLREDDPSGMHRPLLSTFWWEENG